MAEPCAALLFREQSLRCLLDLALMQKSKHESRDWSGIVQTIPMIENKRNSLLPPQFSEGSPGQGILHDDKGTSIPLN